MELEKTTNGNMNLRDGGARATCKCKRPLCRVCYKCSRCGCSHDGIPVSEKLRRKRGGQKGSKRSNEASKVAYSSTIPETRYNLRENGASSGSPSCIRAPKDSFYTEGDADDWIEGKEESTESSHPDSFLRIIL